MPSNLAIPFDAYERNKKIAGLVGKGQKVLDVGGGATGIKLFSENKIKIVDLEVGDIKADAVNLKLPENSYDVVVSVDVLEHIEKKNRQKFIANLLSIAKKKVIVSAPFGSKAHIEAEKDLLKKLQKKGKDDFFLMQHVAFTLPKPDEVDAKGISSREVFYSGDFRVSNFLFDLQRFETGVLLIDKLLLPTRKAIYMLMNIFLYPFWFYKNATDFTNRFYVVIEK